MMQMLFLGTALFPITILIVLTVFPGVVAPSLLIEVGLRALATIIGAATIGFLLRHWLLPRPIPAQMRAIDGAVILFFAIIVIGLMAALGPVFSDTPRTAILWLIAAFALSFSLQAITILALRSNPLAYVAGPLALAAGNRNIALFLVALPPRSWHRS